MENQMKYGMLLNKDIKLHRRYFNEMCKLLGISVIYRSLQDGCKWTNYGEVDANYNPPILLGCIFNDHPDQSTLKKIGWVSELQENASIIHVPYDTPGLQVGCLFIVPSGLDDGKGRLFRCTKLTNIMVYPASIACEIMPEYENTFRKSLKSHKNDSFNLLNGEEEDE
jgi:hypothetical protein